MATGQEAMSRIQTLAHQWLVTDQDSAPRLYDSRADAQQAILERHPNAQTEACRRGQYLFYRESDGSGAARDYVAALSTTR